MFIVHGTEKADALRDRYTVLELDTLHPTLNEDITLYTVIDTGEISLDGMATLEQFTKLHESLITNFKKGNVSFCKDAIGHLRGEFGGQVDSFYDHVLERLTHD
ncbi:MAG: hypothetical protein ACKVJK_13325 [Methylophagaceae bacterium]